uniref:Uncharacterized protein n=1 Tax=Panagrolaimus sp. PS1159 TaxID=55785 RepID=A0AC35GW02_9BILA
QRPIGALYVTESKVLILRPSTRHSARLASEYSLIASSTELISYRSCSCGRISGKGHWKLNIG